MTENGLAAQRMTPAPYCGRFAPTPSGPLHFGSMVAACAAWLDARSRSGRFLVRMEDLDTPRVMPGADTAILRTLERTGLDWDGPVVYQQARIEAYRAAMEQLMRNGRAYACTCSRRTIAARGRMGPEGPVYPGTCRARGLAPGPGRALRFSVPAGAVSFRDRLLGEVTQCLGDEVGDFPLLRADGIVSYQLAVVVDDAWQGITDVVRGADLLASTPRQLALGRALGLPALRYLHVPLAVNAAGEKLAKQTRAAAVDSGDPVRLVRAVLGFLGQPLHPEIDTLADLLAAAVAAWSASRIPPLPGIPAPVI